MTGELDVIYWDACIFYEYLKDEQADMWKRQAIDECLAKNKERLNRLCTSVVTHVEVVPRKLPPPKEEEYWRLFGSVYFYDIPIDKSVIALSREIRNYYYLPADEDGRGGKMMGLGDSIHLATAIIQEAVELHTRDGKKKGGNIPLIGLPESSPNGKLCGVYDLRIVSPVASQGSMALAAEEQIAEHDGMAGEPAATDSVPLDDKRNIDHGQENKAGGKPKPEVRESGA